MLGGYLILMMNMSKYQLIYRPKHWNIWRHVHYKLSARLAEKSFSALTHVNKSLNKNVFVSFGTDNFANDI